MIHLAIDEALGSESRGHEMAEVIDCSQPLRSALCPLLSALSAQEDEDHLDHFHRQTVKVDE